MTSCPICANENCGTNNNKGADFPGFECERCGTFYMTDTLLADTRSPLNNPRLSAWVRDENESGRSHPEFTSNNLPDIIENPPTHNPSQKQIILLQAIERKTKYPGAVVTFDLNLDFPLCWASSRAEYNYLT
jgi:hypothetical protein